MTIYQLIRDAGYNLVLIWGCEYNLKQEKLKKNNKVLKK